MKTPYVVRSKPENKWTMIAQGEGVEVRIQKGLTDRELNSQLSTIFANRSYTSVLIERE